MHAIVVGFIVAALASLGAPSRAAAEPRQLRGVVRVDGRPAKDVVVWLHGSAPAPGTAPARAVLDQRNLAFAPRLLVVPVGTTVEMPNNDRVFHNVFSFHNGKRFDLGLYPTGTRRLVTFDRPGVSRVFCNIHPTMAAYVVAVASTRYAVTGADGRFVIADVDGERHTYSVWRAGADPHSGTFAIDRDQPVTIDWP
jgi:plastocyanin